MKHLYLFLSFLFIGTISYAQTVSFSNTSAITIVDNSTASAYSSDVMASGVTGTVTSVGVIIRNFTHGAPADVAICLEGPSGQKILIQEDMWGAPANDITYMISDLGSSQVGIWDLPSNGTYKPTANSALVSFNAPGPGATYDNPGPGAAGNATMSSVFGGTNANGLWKLWIVDVSGGDAGTINGGWELVINPNSVLPVTLADFSTNCESGNILNVGWTTYDEQNSKDFTIQVSPDASFFEDAEVIKASGNSQIEMTYKASIAMPYAKTFVRLKLTDLNDQVTYSKVLEANCSTSLPIDIRPKLVNEGYFIIDNPNGDFIQFELVDLNGKVIVKGNTKSIHHRLDLGANVVSGMYVLHIQTPKGVQDFKLNKQ